MYTTHVYVMCIPPDKKFFYTNQNQQMCIRKSVSGFFSCQNDMRLYCSYSFRHSFRHMHVHMSGVVLVQCRVT